MNKNILLLVLLLSVVKSQMLDPQRDLFSLEPKPDRCTRPVEFLYRQCCIFPPFFTRDVAIECGALFEIVSEDKDNNLVALRRHPQSLCEHWKCVLSKYDLIYQGDVLDDEKYFNHLDRWTSLNPSFSDVMIKAKHHCKTTFRVYFPIRSCQFYDFHGCIRNFVNVQCPEVFPTKDCYEWQKFYYECKDFYI